MNQPAVLALPHLGVLAIDGPDAATFLQGQATCDTRNLPAGRGTLGALCNLQGRMIVSFFVFPAAGGLHLVMARDRVAHVRTHLQKYAVFSQVKLRDASDEFVVTTGGDDASVALRAAADSALLPDGSAAWRAVAIIAGRLLVDTATADRFLPQALNYDVIDGVSFKKGCYTGQEVVARMHFKGKMKERLYVASAPLASAPAANTAVVDAEGRNVGEVVDAVSSAGTCHVAAVIRHDAVQAGNLRLADASGAPLTVRSAPYPLPDER